MPANVGEVSEGLQLSQGASVLGVVGSRMVPGPGVCEAGSIGDRGIFLGKKEDAYESLGDNSGIAGR